MSCLTMRTNSNMSVRDKVTITGSYIRVFIIIKEGWVDDAKSRIFVLLRCVSLEHILRV